MKVKFLKRGFFQRLLGIPATRVPENPECWRYAGGILMVDLSKAGQLELPGTAVRLEGRGMPVRVLLVHGEDRQFHAFENRCSHLGHRRLDPVPGTPTIQCCSVNKSTYSIEGKPIYGPAPKALTRYPVTREKDRLKIAIS
jgi:nitrite reductase/ring-hydroxylating ferredoxin subunit